MKLELFKQAMDTTGTAVDGAGVIVIVLGALVATLLFLLRIQNQQPANEYRNYRQNLGRAILLGLELLVAGDIIRTVAVEPTLEQVGVLALIVLIRTFLSFSLEVELEGKLPWQRTGDVPASSK
jgi:uncharacterized membrane protein